MDTLIIITACLIPFGIVSAWYLHKEGGGCLFYIERNHKTTFYFLNGTITLNNSEFHLVKRKVLEIVMDPNLKLEQKRIRVWNAIDSLYE